MFRIIIIETNFLPFFFNFLLAHNIFQSFVKANIRDFLLRINFSTSFPQKSHLSNVPFFNGLNAYYKTQLCSHEYTINTPFHAFRIVASTNSSSKNLIQFLISDNISINLLKTKIYISIFFQRQPTRNFKRNYTDSILPIYSYN